MSDMLGVLGRDGRGLTIREIHAAVGGSRTMAQRELETMAGEGLVRFSRVAERWSLTDAGLHAYRRGETRTIETEASVTPPTAASEYGTLGERVHRELAAGGEGTVRDVSASLHRTTKDARRQVENCLKVLVREGVARRIEATRNGKRVYVYRFVP